MDVRLQASQVNQAGLHGLDILQADKASPLRVADHLQKATVQRHDRGLGQQLSQVVDAGLGDLAHPIDLANPAEV